MAKSFQESMQIQSRKLQAAAESELDHPTGVGDGREHLLRKAVCRCVGTSFGVAKAEVVDSYGESSGEIDAVVFDQAVGACIATNPGDRAVVRVEDVAVTIEAKSELKAEHFEDLVQEGGGLLQLHRFYLPSPLLSMVIGSRAPEKAQRDREMLAQGLSPLMHFESIPSVPSFVFGLRGPSRDNAAEHLQLPGIDVVCVLGKYTLAKSKLGFCDNPPEVVLWGTGDDAWGAFLYLLEGTLRDFRHSRAWVAPNAGRYFRPPESLDP